jgi:hypothetical protein
MRIGAGTVALMMIVGRAATVHSQDAGSGSGALTLNASLDVPSVYVFAASWRPTRSSR